MTTVMVEGGLRIPEEPARLRTRIRSLAEQHPEEADARLAEGEWIAARLWRLWGAQLRDRGMRRREFVAVVRGYKWELWLWVMGERTWDHCASGLAGRVGRRAHP